MTQFKAEARERERPGEPVRRLFFALWPDAVLRAALAPATHKAVSACGGRLVPAQSLHATLAFLGSVPERRLAELQVIAGRVAAAFFGGMDANSVPPQLIFDRLEHWRKPQIICATVGAECGEGVAVAGSLAEALKGETTAAGFIPDLNKFRPHVTLARRVLHPIPAMDIDPVVWSFTEFVLVESRTEPGGAVYRVLKSFPSGDPQP
ncbi:MAG: thpR [Gammaproteobacteria bacterium]|nr:thpR [Gammaproteobacteria bacterium]